MSACERPRRETNIRADMTVDLSRGGGGLRGENDTWETLGQGINDREEGGLKSRLSGKKKIWSYKKTRWIQKRHNRRIQTAEESNVQIHSGNKGKELTRYCDTQSCKMNKG